MVIYLVFDYFTGFSEKSYFDLKRRASFIARIASNLPFFFAKFLQKTNTDFYWFFGLFKGFNSVACRIHVETLLGCHKLPYNKKKELGVLAKIYYYNMFYFVLFFKFSLSFQIA